MQLSLALAVCAAVIGFAASAPAVSVPILSLLRDAPSSAYVRPSGQLFRLPLRQPGIRLNFAEQQQQKQTAQPNLYYGVPPEVPVTTEDVEELTTTTELPATTTEVTLEELNSEEEKQQQVAAEPGVEKFDQEGVYYIYHPDGLLQKVAYGTKVQDMGYSARLTYKDVEPIKDPIYTYDPQTLVFSKVEF